MNLEYAFLVDSSATNVSNVNWRDLIPVIKVEMSSVSPYCNQSSPDEILESLLLST